MEKLDDFFWQIHPQHAGFISMNWDTVIERKVAATQHPLIDYCCDALHAGIPEPPELGTFSSMKRYLKEIEKGQVIMLAPAPVERKRMETRTPIVKIHGSANWLCCDNCRRLFWFSPTESGTIANQIIRREDISRIRALLPNKRNLVEDATLRQRQHPERVYEIKVGSCLFSLISSPLL